MWVSYLENESQIDSFIQGEIKEVVIGQLSFSRFSQLSFEEVNSLAKLAKKKGMKVHFEWDILMDQDDLDYCLKHLDKINLDNVDSFRLKDPGAIEYIFQETQMPIQLLFESNNHNLEALMSWGGYLGERLNRFILSIELPQPVLMDYKSKLDKPIEILGVGRILLFYTPRKLMSEENQLGERSEWIADSEESSHQNFPVLENRHGTFMFHEKYFYLLDHLEDLKECADYARIDLRFDDIFESIMEMFETKAYSRDLFSKKTMRGFFHRNKSDVLFKKLKNSLLQDREGDFLGQVLGVERDKMILFEARHENKIREGQFIEIINPNGKKIKSKIKSLKNIDFESIDSAAKNQVISMSYIKGVWPKANVYLSYDNNGDEH